MRQSILDCRPSGRISNDSTTDPPVAVSLRHALSSQPALMNHITECEVAGRVPRFEVPEWRERYGVVAGVTGRGAGEKPFDLGLWTDQPVEQVMRRWRELRNSEPKFSSHVLGHQVHQTRVLWHDGPPRGGWTLIDGVDGHATNVPGEMLYVTIADCIPVYLVDPVAKAIALLHAGWRGTAGRILEEGVKGLFQHAGSSATDIVMHCGIGICGGCYEVGSEVMEGLGLNLDGKGPWHADIRKVLEDQARSLGIDKISGSTWCSAHDRDRFFSHRASKGADGRMVAYLGILPG